MDYPADSFIELKELSDASVPFKFDVHALIFSEDAPGLEAILPQSFRKYEVNKVNPRLEEIQKVVTENYNATADFTIVPEAEEYRESLKLTEAV